MSPKASFIGMALRLLLLSLRRQIGAMAFKHLGGHADGLTEGWMRVDRLADIGRLAAHLDCQADLADQVACVRADDATADHAVRSLVEDQFRESFVAAIGCLLYTSDAADE